MNDINSKDEKRYHDLFKKLDVNSDGKIDVNDLVALFEQNKVSDCQQSHLVRAQVGSRLLLHFLNLLSLGWMVRIETFYFFTEIYWQQQKG